MAVKRFEAPPTPEPKKPEPDAPERTSDPYEVALFAAEIGEAPEIDLHGMSKSLAMTRLDSFFHAQLMQGVDVIKIIHGRGDQVLKKAVIEWLKKPEQRELVAAYRDSHDPRQQGAVILAALHKIK